ncbi:unnamed protein product [Linum tenue]|uniref:Longin domain-containing protein n=1 Tax=Linum tenue TaxID=586396 RepID=A0AAV0RFY1_9ROSI|nr:unnamed protein product [Linum tenue]
MEKTVRYCCVSRGNRALYVYTKEGQQQDIEELATLCLENPPLYHKWYFETIGKRTFGFLMEDGFIYFTIVDEGLRSSGVLRFLEHLRDEFKKVTRKGSRGSSFSGLNSILQEQLVPVISQLINSLEHRSYNEWNAGAISGLSPSTSQIELTKAPLLGKPSKHEKKKSAKDHVIAMRDIDSNKACELTTQDTSSQGASVGIPQSSAQKDLGGSTMRIRPSSQNIRKKWWRQVKIVLAIDVVVCLVLFIIWLSICGGLRCIR